MTNFHMAFPFSNIMRIRLAHVLIMRVIMRRMCSIMRGAFSPSKAFPTYYVRASGTRFDYARLCTTLLYVGTAVRALCLSIK